MKALVLINTVLILVIGVILTLFLSKEKKVAYVNNSDLFSTFKMTQELDREIKAIEENRKSRMDSLTDYVKKIQSGLIKATEEQIEFIKSEYITKRNQFTDEITRAKEASIDKIWKQINQYVIDFGKENKYDIIFGTNGQGNMMFAKENLDITKEVQAYINEKYLGNK